jgi:hypothetical protein
MKRKTCKEKEHPKTIKQETRKPIEAGGNIVVKNENRKSTSRSLHGTNST